MDQAMKKSQTVLRALGIYVWPVTSNKRQYSYIVYITVYIQNCIQNHSNDKTNNSGTYLPLLLV